MSVQTELEEEDDEMALHDEITKHIRELSDQQDRTQKKTFTKWMNVYLNEYNPPLQVKDLFSDIRDGVKLCALLEVLSGEKLIIENKENLQRLHYLTNVSNALKFLESKNIKLVNINTSDVVDGRPVIVLGLIWTIILFFQIEKGAREFHARKNSLMAGDNIPIVEETDSPKRKTEVLETPKKPLKQPAAKETLLKWSQEAMSWHDIEIKNFGTSWRDGKAFNGLVHNVKPSVVDMTVVREQQPKENLEQAFTKAEDHLGIPKLIDAEDVDVEKPDEKSIMTYVGQFLDRYPDANKPCLQEDVLSSTTADLVNSGSDFEMVEEPVCEEKDEESLASEEMATEVTTEEKHTKLMGIEFAPINVPVERRLQTAVILHWVICFLFLGYGSILFSIYLFFFTDYWWVPVLYGVWFYIDKDTCHRGGRRSDWVRRWRMWEIYRDYFPISLVKTADLDPEKNYIFGYHPHGIMGIGSFASFATEATGFSEMFPGIKPYLLTLTGLFWFPYIRDYFMTTGACSVSKESIEWILTNEGKGNAAVIVVGGAAEALEAHPGHYTVKLKSRKGFVKMALKHGASLVPVFSFGENEVFDQADNPVGSKIREIQDKLTHVVGFSPPLFHGRGVFNYTIGLLPFRTPIHTVVGKPISVDKVAEPEDKVIDEYHGKYIDALTDLFDEHKSKYGFAEDVTLKIV